MNGIIYCRVSSKEQVEGTSLESQEAACLEYARQRQITITRVFREEGESAKFADRTQLLALIELCRNRGNTIEVLIVWKLDRFARNVEDHYHIKATLRRHGVQVVSATEPIQADSNGKLLETILAGFAQFDNEIRAARAVQGMRQRIREGIHPWKAPFGYQAAPRDGLKKTQPDQPDPATFPVLKEAWERFASGAYKKAELARWLRDTGFKTAWDRKPSIQFIDQIFVNPFYAGILVDPWSKEEFKGQHTAMVSMETFAVVQQRLHPRGIRRESPPRDRFPLRGLVVCASCGRHLTASSPRGHSKSYLYYHCYNVTCQQRGKSIPASQIDLEFRSFLDAGSINLSVATQIAKLIVQAAEERDTHRAARQQTAAAKVAETDTQIRQITVLAGRGMISEPEFVAHRDLLRRQKLNHAAQVESPTEAAYVRRHAGPVLSRMANLRGLAEQFEGDERRQFQRLLLPKGYSEGKVGTGEKSLLYSLAEASRGPESDWVPFVKTHWNSLLSEIKAFAALLKLPGAIGTDDRISSKESD